MAEKKSTKQSRSAKSKSKGKSKGKSDPSKKLAEKEARQARAARRAAKLAAKMAAKRDAKRRAKRAAAAAAAALKKRRRKSTLDDDEELSDGARRDRFAAKERRMAERCKGNTNKRYAQQGKAMRVMEAERVATAAAAAAGPPVSLDAFQGFGALDNSRGFGQPPAPNTSFGDEK